jgi:peptidoglycan/xylan/chitin deacetylase (PgdA/CDA1 family)
MNKYFGNLWFEAFNYPYGEYNPAAMKAANDCGYKVVYSHFNAKPTRRLFYKLGHLLNKGYLFDKHISWNLDYYPGTKLFEIDANISFIRKYVDEGTQSEMYSLDELAEKTKLYMKYPVISLLAHHRYHNSEEKMIIFQQYIDWTRQFNFEYLTSQSIYNKFAN